MKILFYDEMQNSDAPAALISAPLAETSAFSILEVNFDSAVDINCIGIGNTDATMVQLLFHTSIDDSLAASPSVLDDPGEMSGLYYPGAPASLSTPAAFDYEFVNLIASGVVLNGLYSFLETSNTTRVEITHNGTYFGRIALGKYTELGCSPSREPGLWSTSEPRRTLSGQVVLGAGGVTGREIQVDVKYKVDSEDFATIEAGQREQFGTGLPIFILFDKEFHRMPWERMYASTETEMIFQSSVNQMLYGRQFKFREAF